MSDDDFKRRKFLQASAFAGSGMLIPSVTAASGAYSPEDEDTTVEVASSSNDEFSERISVEDGEITVDASVSASRAEGTPTHEIIEYINKDIREGLIEPFEWGGSVVFRLTAKGRQKVRSTIESLGIERNEASIESQDCDGVTKRTDDGVWFNAEDTNEVASEIGTVAGVTGLVGVIAGVLGFGAPILLLPAVLFGAAGFLLNDFSGDLTAYNYGCGVKVEEYNFVGWDVRTQGRPPCDCS